MTQPGTKLSDIVEVVLKAVRQHNLEGTNPADAIAYQAAESGLRNANALQMAVWLFNIKKFFQVLKDSGAVHDVYFRAVTIWDLHRAFSKEVYLRKELKKLIRRTETVTIRPILSSGELVPEPMRLVFRPEGSVLASTKQASTEAVDFAADFGPSSLGIYKLEDVEYQREVAQKVGPEFAYAYSPNTLKTAAEKLVRNVCDEEARLLLKLDQNLAEMESVAEEIARHIAHYIGTGEMTNLDGFATQLKRMQQLPQRIPSAIQDLPETCAVTTDWLIDRIVAILKERGVLSEDYEPVYLDVILVVRDSRDPVWGLVSKWGRLALNRIELLRKLKELRLSDRFRYAYRLIASGLSPAKVKLVGGVEDA